MGRGDVKHSQTRRDGLEIAFFFKGDISIG